LIASRSINSRVRPLTPKIRNLRIPECCLRQEAIHIQPLTYGISNAPLQSDELEIVRESDGKRTTLRLSGRIQSANVEELREQMKGDAERIGLDLEEVTLLRE
jgi:uncharacterized protein YlaN (UPF0358 family)